MLWPMYIRLCGGRYKNFITSDKACFYITDSILQTKVQYLSRKKRSKAGHFSTTPRSERRGSNFVLEKGQIAFYQPVLANYYIREVLSPSIKEDIPKLYPGRDSIFQQDTSLTHAAKKTMEFLNSKIIPFITPDQWMLNSTDSA